jgi:hypothetical protein
MTQATDQDIREIKGAIVDLTASFTGLREEMRVGFANVDTKFAEAKVEIAEVKGEIKALDTKLEERTRLGFWGFIFRSVIVGLLTGSLLLFVRYLFPIIPSM